MWQTTLTQSGAPIVVLLAGPEIPQLALNTWILSKFSVFYWISLQFILLILVDVELPLHMVVTLSKDTITCFLKSS